MPSLHALSTLCAILLTSAGCLLLFGLWVDQPRLRAAGIAMEVPAAALWLDYRQAVRTRRAHLADAAEPLRAVR